MYSRAFGKSIIAAALHVAAATAVNQKAKPEKPKFWIDEEMATAPLDTRRRKSKGERKRNGWRLK